jgi:hypothetical protein
MAVVHLQVRLGELAGERVHDGARSIVCVWLARCQGAFVKRKFGMEVVLSTNAGATLAGT